MAFATYSYTYLGLHQLFALNFQSDIPLHLKTWEGLRVGSDKEGETNQPTNEYLQGTYL